MHVLAHGKETLHQHREQSLVLKEASKGKEAKASHGAVKPATATVRRAEHAVPNIMPYNPSAASEAAATRVVPACDRSKLALHQLAVLHIDPEETLKEAAVADDNHVIER